MGKRDARIDAYIAKSADFAKPILSHWRELVHEACPEVAENWKWSFPHFDHHGILCSMAAFKQHCAFNFWKASLLSDPHKILLIGDAAPATGSTAMGQFGRVRSMDDLPPDEVLIAYIKEAAELNEKDVKIPGRNTRNAASKELVIPEFFTVALDENHEAAETFQKFNYSQRKEYVEWLTEAKTEETRKKRLATTMEWLAEGKTRNWKYARK